jgi:hypothetical protein
MITAAAIAHALTRMSPMVCRSALVLGDFVVALLVVFVRFPHRLLSAS